MGWGWPLNSTQNDNLISVLVPSRLAKTPVSLQAGRSSNTFIPPGRNHSSAVMFPPAARASSHLTHRDNCCCLTAKKVRSAFDKQIMTSPSLLFCPVRWSPARGCLPPLADRGHNETAPLSLRSAAAAAGRQWKLSAHTRILTQAQDVRSRHFVLIPQSVV